MAKETGDVFAPEIESLLGGPDTPAKAFKRSLENRRPIDDPNTPLPTDKGFPNYRWPDTYTPIPSKPLNPAANPRVGQMMLPTVPQLNPMTMFNRPTGPTMPGGPPPTGLGTPFSQQLLTLLGGLGGMPANPLAPGIARSPQPGPPTNTATQILGALGATNP